MTFGCVRQHMTNRATLLHCSPVAKWCFSLQEWSLR